MAAYSDAADEPKTCVLTSGPYTGPGLTGGVHNIAIEVDPDDRRSSTGRLISGYEDFFGGNLKCPTCDGTGKISRDREHELVALIPVNDKRLHPRRTKLYVGISVAVCVVIGCLLLFFLFPRRTYLYSNQQVLYPSTYWFDQNRTQMFVGITIKYNVSNENFFAVDVQSVSVSMLFGQRILTTVANNTAITVAMRAQTGYSVDLNATFTSEQEYIVQYCYDFDYGIVLVQFQAMATFYYFQRSEQMTLTTYQYVHCPKKK